MINKDNLYTIKEFSEILKISEVTAKRYVSNDVIPSVKIQNIRRIKGVDILNLINKNNSDFFNFFHIKSVTNPKSIHGIYPYRGKISAIDAEQIISQFKPDTTVLDPFCGSGTIVYEANKMGLKSIGVELNPLAYEITLGKISLNKTSLDELILETTDIIDKAKQSLELGKMPEISSKFFHDDTSIEVAKILPLIKKAHPYIRACFFGAVSLTARGCNGYKWTSSSVGKDIQPKTYINFYDKFLSKIKKHYHPLNNNDAKVHLGDSRSLSKFIEPNSIDYILTSPPYFDCLDYTSYYARLIFPLMNWDRDETRGELIQHISSYENDMKSVLLEMKKIMKKDGLIIFVVGDKKVKNQLIKGSDFFNRISPFKLVDVIERSYKGSSSQVFDKLNNTERKEQILIWQA